MSTGAPTRHIVLVGLMATGKSTVGRHLATRLQRRLVDTDGEVEAADGRTVREIWASDGEADFRRLETRALTAAIERGEPTVIAAAGGVVLAEENRAVLADDIAQVVWLRATPETLLHRVRYADDEHRPLLDGDAAGMLEKMFTDRSRLYAAVADVTVDVDGLDVDAVVESILQAVTPVEPR